MNFLPESHTEFPFTGAWAIPALLGLLVSVEWFLARKMGVKTGRDFWKAYALTHLPWLFLLAWPAALSVTLPAPHDFPLRKIEILLGFAWITHFFMVVRLLLASTYKKGLRNSTIFGIVALFLFGGATLWTGTVCEPSGDEPHYLLMAYSLVHDGDLDLSNNYANRDYERFYHRGELQPQALEHLVEGRRYSHHPLGPVLAMLPGFALFGRMGAALTMALLAALALFLAVRALEETGAVGWPVHATGVIGLLSSPLLLFSGLIFPEIPTACLVALALLLYVRKNWLWLGVSLGLMLWMHNRNVLIVIPFLLIAAWEIWKNQKPGSPLTLALSRKGRGKLDSNRYSSTSPSWGKGSGVLNSFGMILGGFAGPVVALSAYFYHIYGVLTPLGAHNEPFTSLFRLSHFWDGFLGLLMDQECGLWFHFPVFGLVLMGGAILSFSRNPLRLVTLGVLLFYYFFMSFYENLGLTPATRYWVGVTPLLLFACQPALAKMKKGEGWAWLTGLSFLVGVFINWLLAAVPWMRYNKLDGENWILKILGSFFHLSLTAINPSFQAPVVGLKTYLLAAFPVLVMVGLTVWFVKEKKEN